MRKLRYRVPEYAMLLPAVVLLTAFVVIPFMCSIAFSFTNERLMPRPIPTAWVGLTNYRRIFTDPEFWQAVGNTLRFAAIVIPLQLALSLGAAMLLNSKLRAMALFRSIIIMPLLIPMTVIAAIWSVMLQTPDGLFNGLWAALTGAQQVKDWLGDPRYALYAIIALSIWASFPFQMLIYLAGLQEIPKTLYEVAVIDGFGRWQQFRYITFPGLRNTHIFAVIITTIGAFSLFTQVNILTGGGPNGATTTIIQYMFSNGFSAQRIGFASAVSVVFFCAVLLLGLAQKKLMSEK
ncbi:MULTISPECIES: carbohydrate ABC transporter permease [unclassified Brenneria]|uniref:carbohydrate ABC transporter permease n=1 Tax=unclassified Brenneria TaxID=2634434 RepID=UPI0015571794|nr:sugar ABC transporter permease [Brenneria sp. hezel4-2-4]MEE3650425.1 sugar ABC transporter permease [Brenneria sp. HEZEL_4_2_4]NPD00381.1 sugar ABC transporter permease [Brenneria sp. hezel4-2-4]